MCGDYGVTFNNHYKNFLAYTPKSRQAKRGIPWVCLDWNSLWKDKADLQERILDPLAHVGYPTEKFPPSYQHAGSKSIKYSFTIIRGGVELPKGFSSVTFEKNK